MNIEIGKTIEQISIESRSIMEDCSSSGSYNSSVEVRTTQVMKWFLMMNRLQPTVSYAVGNSLVASEHTVMNVAAFYFGRFPLNRRMPIICCGPVIEKDFIYIRWVQKTQDPLGLKPAAHVASWDKRYGE